MFELIGLLFEALVHGKFNIPVIRIQGLIGGLCRTVVPSDAARVDRHFSPDHGGTATGRKEKMAAQRKANRVVLLP